MEKFSEPLFYEKQRYKLRWLWLIYLFIGLPLFLLVLYSSWVQLQEGAVAAGFEVSQRVLLLLNGLALFILLAVPVFINSMVLKVWVFPDHINIRYGPWYRQKISLAQVEQLQLSQFDPLEIFGTHDGYRTTRAIKKLGVFSVRGHEAVKLRLRNGMEVLIGSQKPADLFGVLMPLVNREQKGRILSGAKKSK